MSETFQCTYCGRTLPSADTYHDIQNCAEHLLIRLENTERELAELKERTRWIPVGERLPEIIERPDGGVNGVLAQNRACMHDQFPGFTYHMCNTVYLNKHPEEYTFWYFVPKPPEADHD